MQRVGKGSAVKEPVTEMHGRVAVLEHGLDSLSKRMETGFAGLTSTLSDVSKAISQHRNPIPFKEIAATVVTCMAIFAYVGNYLEGQHAKNMSVWQYRVEQLEKTAHKP